MVSAKARIAAYREKKEQMKYNQMALIDDYVSNILSDSLNVGISRRPSTQHQIDSNALELDVYNSASSSQNKSGSSK